MPDREQQELERAARIRRARIKVISACVCSWPVVVMRNGSGHVDHCLAHGVWKSLSEDERG